MSSSGYHQEKTPIPKLRAWLVQPALCIFGLLVLCGSTSFAQGVLAQGASGPVKVRGVVLNQITREPISRALVYSQDNLYATLTDDRGRFEFTFPAQQADAAESSPVPNDRTGLQQRWIPSMRNGRPSFLLARKPGYLSPAESSQIMIPDALQSDLVVLLEPEGLIVGHVQFSTLDNADRIRLELFRRDIRDGHERWEQSSNFTTWADGEFRFYELQPGTYKLVSLEQLDRDPASFNPHAQLFGYQPGFYPAAQDFDSAGAIQIAAGETFQAKMSVVRREYYPVRIPVANSIAGVAANVLVFPQGHPGPGFSLGYNANEQRIQGMLPDGNYTVRLVAQGSPGSSGTLNFSVRCAPMEGPPITLLENATLPINVNEEFSANRESPTEPSSAPSAIRDRSFRAELISTESYGPEQNRFSQPVEGTDGHSYTIENVPPGRYWVRIFSDGSFLASALCGGTDVLRHPLVVSPGQTNSPLEVTLRDDGADVSGSIQGMPPKDNAADFSEGGRAVAFVYFIPLGDGAGQFRETMAGPDGSFHEEQLPPGIYRVLAFQQQQAELELAGPEVLRKYEAKGQVIHVTASQKERLPTPLVALSE